MKERIFDAARSLKDELSLLRRDFHRYPELAFREFRTTAKIASYLEALGFIIKIGKEAIDMSSALGIPSEEVLASERQRAIAEGVSEEILSIIGNGATGVVADIIGEGAGAHKNVSFRFDIDAVAIEESTSSDHLPYREGFSSVHSGCAHCCGHDGHIEIGLGLARLLSENKDLFSGRVRLIFQPAEEGVHGAGAMVAAGVLDDSDYLFSGHLGMSANDNSVLSASTGGFLCASKFDAEFFGLSAHAGMAPEEGKNAILAAAQATLALHAISRHGKGASRVNVGVITGGTGRNVIPDYASVKFETRGETDEINDYMRESAKRIIDSAASMYGLSYKLELVGHAGCYIPDEDFAKEIALLAKGSGLYEKVIGYSDLNASEDCSELLNKVVTNGGKTSYMLYGTKIASPHHTPEFDFDEQVLSKTVSLLALLAHKYS